MPKPVLIYGICGEGLGHAARAYALIERLEQDFEVHILTSGDAYEFFSGLEYPHLHLVGGIRFVKQGQSIDWAASILHCFKFVANGRTHLQQATAIWETIRPDVAITDFEPLVPRIALRNKIPVLAIDNQSKISHCQLKDLPRGLRIYQAMITPLIEWMVPRSIPRVVSCFHPEFCIPKKKLRAIVGPLIRSAITRLQPTDQGFVLVYYKEVLGERLLQATKELKMPTVVFGGMHLAHRWPDFEFRPHGTGFAEALAACSILVCPAGNQLLGEARFFGKRTICFPQKGQHEQGINAFYMEKVGLGTAVWDPAKLRPDSLDAINSLTTTPYHCNEVEKVVQMIFSLLTSG